MRKFLCNLILDGHRMPSSLVAASDPRAAAEMLAEAAEDLYGVRPDTVVVREIEDGEEPGVKRTVGKELRYVTAMERECA